MWKGGTEEDASSDYARPHTHTHPESQVMCSIFPAACGLWLSSWNQTRRCTSTLPWPIKKTKTDWGNRLRNPNKQQQEIFAPTMNWKWPVKSDEAESVFSPIGKQDRSNFLNENILKSHECALLAVTIWKHWTCKRHYSCVFFFPCRYCIIENRRIIFF